jgi:hypothetical protein
MEVRHFDKRVSATVWIENADTVSVGIAEVSEASASEVNILQVELLAETDAPVIQIRGGNGDMTRRKAEATQILIRVKLESDHLDQLSQISVWWH